MSFNTEEQCQNINFKPTDILSQNILLFKPSFWCQKKSLENSETKYIYWCVMDYYW